MKNYRLLVSVVLFSAACSGGGGGQSVDSGSPSGSGGKVTGSGGASPAGTGGSATGGSGGSQGTGGAGGMGGSGGMVAMPTGQSVTERSGGPARTGHFIRPALTKANAAMMAADAGFNATYMGNIWNTPLFVENGPGGKGAFYVATQQNQVYAFDATTGAQIWMKSVGAVAQGGPCGNFGYTSVGVFGTPAIDLGSKTIFVAAANGPNGIQSFKVHAFNLDDGSEKAPWPLDLGTIIGGGFNAAQQNQRGALTIVNGILYIPLGGHVGDCGDARGRVVAINITDPTKTGAWATSDQGSTIWAPGGLASDGTGIFATTGNHFPNNTAPATHGDSEEVVRLTGLAQLTRNDQNIFYPMRWRAMDSGDLDFGANSPLVMDVPGATPAKFIAASSKDGHIYFLDPNNLGGMGGQKFDLTIAAEGMSSLKTTPASYVTATGAYVVLSTGSPRGCPAGVGGSVVMGVSVAVAGGMIQPKVAWCSAISGDGSPVVTTTDGKTDAIVWYISGGMLKGVDGDTGTMVFQGGNCAVQRWNSPIVAAGGRIVAGANGKLCSWSVPP